MAPRGAESSRNFLLTFSFSSSALRKRKRKKSSAAAPNFFFFFLSTWYARMTLRHSRPTLSCITTLAHCSCSVQRCSLFPASFFFSSTGAPTLIFLSYGRSAPSRLLPLLHHAFIFLLPRIFASIFFLVVVEMMRLASFEARAISYPGLPTMLRSRTSLPHPRWRKPIQGPDQPPHFLFYRFFLFYPRWAHVS